MSCIFESLYLEFRAGQIVEVVPKPRFRWVFEGAEITRPPVERTGDPSLVIGDPEGWWEERLARPASQWRDWETAEPNPGHHALAELERMGIFKALLTQNIDGLHKKAGSRNVLEYHGNAFLLRCMEYNARFHRDEFDLQRLKEEEELPSRCPDCGGVVKSDGVAFGEPIPRDVARGSLEEAVKCDFMLICGTSAVVHPFANLPRVARARKAEKERQTESGLHVVEEIPAVTIIEVNAEPTPLTSEGISDYLIQGKTGEVLPKLARLIKQEMKTRGG